jgi:predicted nucleotidyltransferase
MPRHIKKLLKEFKQELTRIYGQELKAVYLYGSYARGEAHPIDSDIDVLVVLKGSFNYIEALKRSEDFTTSFCLDNNVVVSRAFVSEAEYKSKQTPFLINVRRDAVVL